MCPQWLRVKRAWPSCTVGAYVSLVIDARRLGRPALALTLGGLFVLLATVGFAVVRPRTGWAYGYIAALLLLSYAVFGASASTGATLMIVVVVCQSVVLLALPAAVVVVALTPFVHVGMSVSDGLREGLGLLAATAFAAVVTRLLTASRRPGRAAASTRGRPSDGHGARNATGSRATSTTASGTRSPSSDAGQGGPGRVGRRSGQGRRRPGQAQDQAEEALREVRRSVARCASGAAGALAGRVARAGAPRPACRPTSSWSARPCRWGPRPRSRCSGRLRRADQRAQARGAARAWLAVDYSRPALVRLEVRDDGAGLSDGGSGGFGLVGLRERAVVVGGSVTLSSRPGRVRCSGSRCPDEPGAGAAGRRPALFREALSMLLSVRPTSPWSVRRATGPRRCAGRPADAGRRPDGPPDAVLDGVGATRRLRPSSRTCG